MQKITPSLWFDNNCEEAMSYYAAVFPNSKIVSIQYYPENVKNEHLKNMSGKVLNGIFELDGMRFICLDGGPIFKFNESISFTIDCKDQEEVDYFWEKLSAVPESEQCGWVKDKFGVSWQIVPRRLGELMSGPDKEKSGRAMEALMKMKKIDIAALEAAYKGE